MSDSHVVMPVRGARVTGAFDVPVSRARLALYEQFGGLRRLIGSRGALRSNRIWSRVSQRGGVRLLGAMNCAVCFKKYQPLQPR